MKPPLYVHPLSPKEHRQLEAARRSSNVFCLRRAQIVLASARGQSAKPIAQFLGCSVQTIRNVIRAFNAGGMSCLAKRSNRPKSAKPTLDVAQCEQLRHVLHQSPRRFGKPTGLWTLALAAQVCHEQGITERPLSDETIRGGEDETCKILAQGFDLFWGRREPEFFCNRWRHMIKA